MHVASFLRDCVTYGQVGESNNANEEEYSEEDPAFSASQSTPIQVVLACSNMSCIEVPVVLALCFLPFAKFLPHRLSWPRL